MSTDSAALAINTARLNPFSNFSNLALADAMGDLEATIKTATERRDFAREEMTRRHLSALEGSRFTVTKDVKSEKRFDSAAAKAKMGLDWYATFQKPGSRTTYTVTVRPLEQLGVPA